MFGLLGHNYSSRAACAPLARRRTSPPTGRFLWCSSAHLNQSLSLQTVACRRMVFPCCTSGLPPSFQPFMSAPVENVLGRVPMIPCFLRGNTNNTIPYSLWYEVPDCAAADSRHDSRTGSRLFEVNVWMWNYGRAFLRKISVADAEEMRVPSQASTSKTVTG